VAPEDAVLTAHQLLQAADAALERPLAGLYLTGSAVLHDYVPQVSDLDFVAVVAPDADVPLAALGTVHAGLPQTDGLYLTAAQLRCPPADVGAVPHARDGQVWRSDDHVIPVTWQTLAVHGATVRGPSPSSLRIPLDRDGLVRWCRGNLHGYWAQWARGGADDAGEYARAIETDRGMAWCVLGVLRLAYTIATGEITSKRGAGRYGLATLPAGWHPLIAEAIVLRAAPPDLSPPADPSAAADRRRQVVALMDEVIAAA
jgi:hypothetical protein